MSSDQDKASTDASDLVAEIDSFLSALDHPTQDDDLSGWSAEVRESTRDYLRDLRGDIESGAYRDTRRNDHHHLARWYDGIGNGPLSDRLTNLQGSLHRVFHVPTAPNPEADRETEAALRTILDNLRRRPGWIPGPGEDG